MSTQRPRCAKCNCKLYRSAEKGTLVRRSDPYVFCRNEFCPEFSQRKSKSKVKNRNAKPTQKAPPENESIKKLRVKIANTLLDVISGKYDKTTVAIALAILCQETQNLAAANTIIQEHDLEMRFGLRQQGDPNKP